MGQFIAISFPIDFEGHENFKTEPIQVNIRPKIKSFVQNIERRILFGVNLKLYILYDHIQDQANVTVYN